MALLEELEKLGISRRHMTEIFVNQYGQTPTEYANARRIQAAKEQLKNQDNSILDIALSLGFESLSSFYIFFRKHTKMSPGDYRQQYKTSIIQCFFRFDSIHRFPSFSLACAGLVYIFHRFKSFLFACRQPLSEVFFSRSASVKAPYIPVFSELRLVKHIL